MELQHLNVKLFAERPAGVERELFTPIFHSWIQDQVCEELLIDVADYLHVPAGPGIVLVGYEADYSMDETGQRLGLRYNRKKPLPGDNRAKLSQALRAALIAARRLEGDTRLAGNLRFNRRELELFVNDRAIAPNTPATWSALRGELENFFSNTFGTGTFELRPQPDPRERFGVTVNSKSELDFEALSKTL
ncbi:MAG: hypothetical protein U1F66_05200 [bacterium]